MWEGFRVGPPERSGFRLGLELRGEVPKAGRSLLVPGGALACSRPSPRHAHLSLRSHCRPPGGQLLRLADAGRHC